MQRSTFASALAGSLLLSASGASAEPLQAHSTLGLKIDEPDVVFAESGTVDGWERHRFAVLARLETLGPIGIGGVGVEYGIDRWFSVGVAVGSNSNDVQAASMARFRFPLGVNGGVGIGLGASYGRAFDGGACPASSSCSSSRPPVVSGDGELFIEGRSDEGFLIRLYGGLHRNFDHQQQLYPYFGLGLGFAL